MIGFGLTIGAQLITSPSEGTSDLDTVLVDEARLLAWHAGDGTRGIAGSVLAWAGIAAWITTATLFVRANRVR